MIYEVVHIPCQECGSLYSASTALGRTLCRFCVFKYIKEIEDIAEVLGLRALNQKMHLPRERRATSS